jgi:photosystem II stability/assembly factor-like uncharacterized protein
MRVPRVDVLWSAAAIAAACSAPGSVSGAASETGSALVPNAVVFLSRTDGVLGTGVEGCGLTVSSCRRGGTIALTSDGGKTWQVVRRTPQAVVSVLLNGDGRVVDAQYDDGETLRSADGGHTWHVAILDRSANSVCPQGMTVGINTQPTPQDWALCTSQPGAGNQGKEVFRLRTRGWARVACTTIDGSGCHYGGISSYGYPQGIAAARRSDFAIIWETRGTLYVTRNGGRHWIALPKVAPPDAFSWWASVLPHGLGFVILDDGGIQKRRLIETTDAGRTWHVVHRWAATG